MTPAQVVIEARSWVGVPFRHQGRNRLGIDCAGLVVCVVASTAGLPEGFDPPRRYGRAPHDEFITTISRYCRETSSAVAGAIALIKWARDGSPSHVGILTSETIIHSYASAKRVVEHGYRGNWVDQTHSYWLLPGIDYGPVE